MSVPADHPQWQPPGSALVGRERERAALRDALDSALGGRGSLVLIGGEAGIGKTALAEVLLTEAQQQGALALVGRCYDLAETPPYGPWLEAMRGYLPEGDLPPLPAFLTESEALRALAGPGALQAATWGFFAAVAACRPLVLLLDDLHWADDASLDLLRVAARRLAAAPLLLVATYRADEVTRGHPLYALLPLLAREGQAARLELRPLGGGDLAGLARGRYALPPAATARLVAYLAGRAEGNPLYTGELLRTLEEEGALRRNDAGWALGDLAAVGIPPLLRQVIDARVDRLGADTRTLLATAAVIGQEVPLDLWAAVAGVAEEALLDAVERAAEAHILAEAPIVAGYRFTHALVREALYEATPLPRRRARHRQVGEALAARRVADPDAVAYHLQRAGDPRAFEWLLRAGERARRAYAWTTAAGRYEAALALLEREQPADARRGWLLLRLAALHRYADAARSVAHLDEAVRWGAEAFDPALAALAAFYRGHLRFFVNEPRQGLREITAGLAALGALPPEARSQLHELAEAVGVADGGLDGYMVHWLAHLGRYAEAVALGERVVAGAPPAAVSDGGTSPHGDTYYGLMQACAMLGEPAEARRACEPFRERYVAAAHYFNLGGATADAVVYLALPYYADDLPWRRHLARVAEDAWARVSGAFAEEDPVRAITLPLLLLEGCWDEADALGRVVGPAAFHIWRTNHFVKSLVQLARGRGRADEAWQRIARAIPDGPATAPGELHCGTTLVLQRHAAALALDAGDLPLAHDWLAAHDRWLAWSGAVLGRAEGALGWAELHRASGDPAAARLHADRGLAHATKPRQPLALIAAHRLLGELATAAGRHADAATHLDAALALADACAAPYERALTLLALGELHVATASRAPADETLAEARRILEPLEARPALARADALARRLAAAPAPAARSPALPFGLTPREAEVLRLVAAGLTDAQIAARLFVSRHTVNGHTKVIYGKLGVTSRAAATRLALDHDLR